MLPACFVSLTVQIEELGHERFRAGNAETAAEMIGDLFTVARESARARWLDGEIARLQAALRRHGDPTKPDLMLSSLLDQRCPRSTPPH